MLKMTLLFSLALNRPITKKKDTAVTALYNVQQKETGNLSFPFPSSQLAGKKEKKKKLHHLQKQKQILHSHRKQFLSADTQSTRRHSSNSSV